MLYRAVGQGFIEKLDEGRWALSKKGFFIMDSIIKEFGYV